jgi:hypothetical protein
MIKPLRHLELMARIKTQLALKRSIKVRQRKKERKIYARLQACVKGALSQ